MRRAPRGTRPHPFSTSARSCVHSTPSAPVLPLPGRSRQGSDAWPARPPLHRTFEDLAVNAEDPDMGVHKREKRPGRLGAVFPSSVISASSLGKIAPPPNLSLYFSYASSLVAASIHS